MIKEFSVKNFNSINDIQNISFSISKKDMLDNSSFKTDGGMLLNNVISIIGNNASGKTNILKALSFLLWFSRSSYQTQPTEKKINIDCHELSKSKNSEFVLIWEQNTHLYKYILHLNKSMVIYESLSFKKDRKYVSLYEIKRTKTEDKILKYNSKDLTGKVNDNDMLRFSSRKNITFLSFLLNTGHLSKIGLNNLFNFNTNLGYFGMAQINKFERHNELTSEILKHKTFLLSMLKKFGLGIEDFYIEDLVLDEKETLQQSKIKLLKVVHKSENENKFTLSFFQESDGTQNIMYLLNKFIPMLKTGGIIIIDEIENSIHPYLIKNIINMIADKSINKFNVQLIFSTHMPYLLDDRTKTQIYIVEKNNELSTEVYRLASVEGVRNDDNFCNKYLAGAYGGVSSGQRWF